MHSSFSRAGTGHLRAFLCVRKCLHLFECASRCFIQSFWTREQFFSRCVTGYASGYVGTHLGAQVKFLRRMPSSDHDIHQQFKLDWKSTQTAPAPSWALAVFFNLPRMKIFCIFYQVDWRFSFLIRTGSEIGCRE